MSDAREAARAARQASFALAASASAVRSGALLAVADALQMRREEVFAANRLDLDAAAELAAPVRKRLRFD